MTALLIACALCLGGGIQSSPAPGDLSSHAATRPANSEPVAANAPPLVIVLCGEGLQPALQPWIEYRQKQGYEVRVLKPARTAELTQKRVRAVAERGNVAALLICGKPGSGPDACPVGYMTAQVNIEFGSTPMIATDNVYADLDDDFAPDISVGRIPVDSVEMLGQVLERGIAYEINAEHGDWRRRINLIAGVGGFDPVVDRVIESSTQGIISQMMPAQYDVSMTWGSWTSPYCPAPSHFHQTVIDRFNEGCLFWVYVGHGWVDRLDRVKTPGGDHLILDNETVPQLSASAGNPVALMLCCFTCAFDASYDCLGQKMLEQPAGPVAVIGGTRMTMPYGMGRMSIEMMDELFHGDCETLGELLLLTKRRILTADDQAELKGCRKMVQAIATAFSPFPDKLDDEIREHVAMMHLLGDPLLRLARPLEIPTQAHQARAGETMVVSGEAPVGGTLVVEACYTLGRFWNRPGLRKETDLAIDRSDWMQSEYDKCRDMVCSRQAVEVQAGPFSVELAIPAKARGDAVIRTFIEGTSVHAAGATSIEIEAIKR